MKIKIEPHPFDEKLKKITIQGHTILYVTKVSLDYAISKGGLEVE